MSILGKRASALKIGYALIESGETDVTEADMLSWRDDDLYDWLEHWGYAHDGTDWFRPEFAKQDKDTADWAWTARYQKKAGSQ